MRTEIAKHCCCKGKTRRLAIVTITEGKLKQVRRRLSRRRGWTTGEFDAHLAEWVSERGVEVKYLPESSRSNQRRLLLHHPLPRVDIAVETEALVASMKSTAAKEFQRVQTAVLRWVRRRCRKSKERWEVETSHMNDMKHNLSAATKAVAVQAVVALLAARGIVCIKHDREKAKGQRQPSSSSSDWVTKALQWAAETASWIDVGEVEELVRLAAKNINTASNDNKAIVELGCGWEGATEGLARVFGQVVTLDKRQQLISSSRCSVDGKARYSHPSVLGDFRQPCANLVHWVRKKAGLSKDELRAVWASPSCTGHSRRQGMLRTNATTSHRAQGRFAGRPMCEEEAEATRAVFDSVWDWWSEDKANRRYCIENVESAKMDEEIERRFGRGIVVKACRFGKQSGKTHRLWLSKETEAAFLERYNDPERTPRCPYCDVRPRRKHPQSGLPRKGSGQQREHEKGKTRTAAANRTRPELAEAVAMCLF